VLNKKFRSRLHTGKLILFFFSIFFCSYIQAQDETVVDTNAVDTADHFVEPPKEEQKYETSTEEKKTNYFLGKNLYGKPIDSLQLRTLPGSVVKKIQGDDDYWYANAQFKKEKAKQEDASYVPLGQRSWFQILLWLIIIGGFAGFIIWYLAGNNVKLFRKKTKAIDGEGHDEVETDDIFAINYQKEIDKAAREKNFRLAVRLMFLRLLKNLTEKNIIHYSQGKTNLDYLMQLHPTRYYKDFFRITRNYEYSWYGEFEVNEKAYYIIRSDFDNFDRQLK